MRSLRPEKRWRQFPQTSPGARLRPAAFQAPAFPPPDAEGPRAAWAFPCPNPFCDTELVVPPEQAGLWVECPECGLRIMLPLRAAARARQAGKKSDPKPDVWPETPAKPVPPADAKSSKTLGALEALSRASHAPGSAPAPAGIRRGVSPAAGGTDRRTERRMPMWQRLEAKAAAEQGRKRRPDLALTWVVALAAAAGVVVAAFASGVHDLALGSILFVGLAGVRTVMITSRR
jgi:DNA-directed RNA polymerase subunit RPC12/RpoP